MTLRTEWVLECSCGHRGGVTRAENDSSFSKQYESYSLQSFAGTSYYIEGFASIAEAIAFMRPECPECSAIQTADNVVG